MAKLLNRAYERLNDVLQLAGNQVVNDIDIGSAFPVHPLTGPIQDVLAFHAQWYTEITTGPAATTQTALDPFSAADWDAIFVETRDLVGDFGDIVPAEYDVIIERMMARASAGSTSFQEAVFQWADALPGGTTYWAMTSPLDTLSLLNSYMPTSGEPYYLHSPPFNVPKTGAFGIRIVNNGGANVVTDVELQGWIVQRGAYDRL